MSKLDSCYRPTAPFHKVAGVRESVDEQEERVPQTSAGEHAHKVQIPVLADVVDH